ncbi:hypothetical protein H6758_02920 [Candidatus Nomurabacteria bacterium]|nr:hypothetical protein [Candidatus Nomurabacteria bacterium]
MKKFAKKITSFFIVALLFAPTMAGAVGLQKSGTLLGQTASKTGVDTSKQVEDVVGAGIRAGLTLVGLIFLVLMVYAGYLWMTARGEESQVDKAKKIVSTSIIGLVLVVGAYAITFLITSRLGR